MQKQILSKAIAAAVPLVLGFLGSVSSTFFPAYFAAFCSGQFV